MHSRQVEPTATDSSQDELDLDGDEEDDELGIVPKKTAPPSGQPLKRKDGGWDIGTASKRLKLKEPDISDGVGSISAPGASGDDVLDIPSAENIIAVPPTTSSNISSSVAGPSKTSTSISARASTSSSMAPPADAPRRSFGKSTLDFMRQKPSRPLTSEQKAASSSSSRPSTSEAVSSSQRVKPSNHPPSSVSSKKPPALPAKPKPSENEIIEISSDSDSDTPPPPKRDIKPKIARKSTGGHQLGRSSPPKRKNDPDPEIIEILDSDDEVAKPQVTTGKSVTLANRTRHTAKVEEDAPISKPPAEDAMDIDHSSDAPVEVDAPRKGIDVDHPMHQEPNISAALRWTPSPPLKPKLEPATPAQPSLQPQPSSSSIKKPNGQGFNPISIPGDITLPPSPTKRRLQTAVKTASGSFKQREISPSSCSASSPAGDSESGEESSNLNSRGSTSDPGPDLRNLTDALGINSTGHSSPEPQVLTKKLPTPPKATNQPVSIIPHLMFYRFSYTVAIGTL